MADIYFDSGGNLVTSNGKVVQMLKEDHGKLLSRLSMARKALEKISRCEHIKNCGYVHAPCICHRKFADEALSKLGEK